MDMNLWAIAIMVVFMFATLLMAAVSNMAEKYYNKLLIEEYNYLLKHENIF